jgi:hypothetical protein
MITRPLDLATRLRPPPRSFDYLFWINGVLIALFFTFFGSRFVLSPGMGVGRVEEILPPIAGAVQGAVPTQLTVAVTEAGLLYVDTGFVSFEQFRSWLEGEAKRYPGSTLLVRLNLKNPTSLLAQITSVAGELGLNVQLAGVEPVQPTSDESRF